MVQEPPSGASAAPAAPFIPSPKHLPYRDPSGTLLRNSYDKPKSPRTPQYISLTFDPDDKSEAADSASSTDESLYQTIDDVSAQMSQTLKVTPASPPPLPQARAATLPVRTSSLSLSRPKQHEVKLDVTTSWCPPTSDTSVTHYVEIHQGMTANVRKIIEAARSPPPVRVKKIPGQEEDA